MRGARNLLLAAILTLLPSVPAVADRAEDDALKAYKKAYTRVLIREKTYQARELDRELRVASDTWVRPWLDRGKPDAPKVIEYDFSGYRAVFEKWIVHSKEKGELAIELAKAADGPEVAKRLLTRLLEALSNIVKQNFALAKSRPKHWSIHDQRPAMYRYGDGIHVDALVNAIGLQKSEESLAWLMEDGVARVEKWGRSWRTDSGRIALLDALAKTGQAVVQPLLAAAAGSPDRRLRLVGLECLAALPEDRDVLRGRLEDVVRTEPAYAVRVAAIEILAGKLRDPLAIPALADALTKEIEGPNGIMRAHLMKAMAEIVGKDLGPAPESWLAWFKANLKAIEDGTWERGEDVRDATKNPDQKDSVAFYDIRTVSQRIAVLIDASDTLIKPVDIEVAKKKNYFEWRALAKKDRNFVSQYDLLRKETSKLVTGLRRGARFNLLLMNGSYKVTPFWPRGMAKAEKAIKKLVDPWLEDVIVGGWAPQLQGIWEAYRLAGYDPWRGGIPEEPLVDTIFLLSDGVPSGGQIMYGPALVDDIRRHHRFARIPIHAIRIDDYEDTAEEVMKGVAEVTGGTYVWRTKP